MIYRIVNDERMPQVAELWDYCFEKKHDPFFKYYFQEYCGKDNMVIGAFEKVNEDEKLRSMIHINPYMLRIREQEMLVPYLVGIATAPEVRGQHLLKPLLQTTFEVLRSQGFTFVTLMPLFAGIYLPYQFTYCYYRHSYKMPLCELRNLKSDTSLLVERRSLEKELLAPIYERLTAKWNGVPKRTDFQWNKLLKVHGLENVQCAVVYREEKAVGYMLYQIADNTFTVLELLADDFIVKNRLLLYAAQHQSAAEKFSWLAEAWDKTYLNFANQKLSGRLYPFMMARCLDARQALNNISVSADMQEDKVVILLTDKIIEHNNHLLLLETKPEKLKVTSTIEQEQVVMDMGVFTQLYMGAFSATELWEAGYLKCYDFTKLPLLDKLFPKCRNYINEYF